ncbi:hypothetical protein SEVIR_2G031250v4 [Setaria viridis]
MHPILTVPFLTVSMAACSWRSTAGWPGRSPQLRQAPARPRSPTWSRAPSTAAQPHPRLTANVRVDGGAAAGNKQASSGSRQAAPRC